MNATAFKNHLTLIGWSQRRLAQAYGVSHIAINRYVTGERQVPDDLARWLEEFARFLARYPFPKRP